MTDPKAFINELARDAGFDAVRVTAPDGIDPKAAARLSAFIEAGRHGDMDWLARNAERRRNPRKLWSEARSIVMLAMNYGPDGDPLAALESRSNGVISCYAKGRDYHDIIKKRLKRVAGAFHAKTGAEVKVFVDTAPLMEKPAAAAAGIGWQGKHTNLVSLDFGSWLFLGAIATTMVLVPDEAETDHCGACTRCLDICPTRAFPKPYQLDARRCISYLTIEHKGTIPMEFRAPIGNRIYGCDDCLAVCPWNKFAQAAAEAGFQARDETDDPPLAQLLDLDDAGFRTRFRGSPIKRTGRDRFIRNVLIAAGNSEDVSLLPQITALLQDRSKLVRGMAVWASRRLMPRDRALALRKRFAADETDQDVQREWDREIVK